MCVCAVDLTTVPTEMRRRGVFGITTSKSGLLFVSDFETYQIYSYDPISGAERLVAGLIATFTTAVTNAKNSPNRYCDGDALTSRFESLRGIAISESDSQIAIAEAGGDRLRLLTLQ